MESSEIEALLDRYRKGEATAQESAWVESWYLDEGRRLTSYNKPIDYEAKGRQIWAQIEAQKTGRTTRIYRLWPRIAIAAAIAVLVFGAGLFYFGKQQPSTQQTASLTDISPGKIGATLTLSSGKKIRLAEAVNGELASEAGVNITKSADGKLIYEIKSTGKEINNINTLSTANGETYQVRLPDGSLVWLNAASTLTYSARLLQDGKRKVEITGEGYFEIAKDKQHPFVVSSGGQQVEVLGTHFNVNSYANEPEIRTTLLEGSVRLRTAGAENILKPGEQATLKAGRFTVAKVDTEEAIAWKEGYFMFNEESLESIMRKVSRWYDVEVVYQDATLKEESFGGRVSRFSNVSEVLEILELTGLAKFKVEGRRIMVSK